MATATSTLAISPPQDLPKNGKLCDNWRQWKQNFDIYLGAAGIASSDEKVCSLFLHCIGQHGRNIFNDLGISEPYTLKEFYARFDEYCNPKRNLIFERYTFFNTRQEGSPFDKFYALLKKRSLNCELGELTDSLIGTQIVIGINNAALRKQLLSIPDLTLNDIVQMCKSAEAAKLQACRMEALTPSTSTKKSQNQVKPQVNPDIIEKLAQKLESNLAHKLESNLLQKLESSVQISDKKVKPSESNKDKVKEKPAVITNCKYCSGTHKYGDCPKLDTIACKFCGKSHKKGNCPAHGSVCHKCKKTNHFVKMCHA